MQERKEKQEQEKQDLVSWRRYLRHTFENKSPKDEPSSEEIKSGKAIRVQIRLAAASSRAKSGAAAPSRHVKAFYKDDTLGTLDLFHWAESLLAPPKDEDGADPATPPHGFIDPYTASQLSNSTARVIEIYTSYPRKQVSLSPEGWDVVVQGGGSLVLETSRTFVDGLGDEGEDDDGDESSDEE